MFYYKDCSVVSLNYLVIVHTTLTSAKAKQGSQSKNTTWGVQYEQEEYIFENSDSQTKNTSKARYQQTVVFS